MPKDVEDSEKQYGGLGQDLPFDCAATKANVNVPIGIFAQNLWRETLTACTI
jgi:hypothetical protein